jgi:hypothetical protein
VEESKRWRSGEAVASAADLWNAFEAVNRRTPVEVLRRVAHEVGASVWCVWLDFTDSAAASRFAGEALRKAIRGPLTGELLEQHTVTWDERRRRAMAEQFATQPPIMDGRLIFLVTSGREPTIYASVHELAQTTPMQAHVIADNVRLACKRLLDSSPPLAGLLAERGDSFVRADVIDRLKAKCTACDATANLKLCVRCGGARYCSKACQEGDWRRHKQGECADIKLMVDLVM